MRRPLLFILGIWIAGELLAKSAGLALTPETGLDRCMAEKTAAYVSCRGEIRQVRYTKSGYSLVLTDNETVLCGRGYGSGDILVNIKEADELAVGNRVEVSGKLAKFDEAANPGQFDLRDYYRAQGIDYSLRADEIRVIDSRFEPLGEGLRRLRDLAREQILSSAPEEDAGIYTSLLLGDRSNLSEDVRSDFREGGISHILAISGLHISLFGMALHKILKRVGVSKLPGALISGGMAAAYVTMTGGSSTSTRALIMFCLYLTAEVFGRSYDSLSALGAACLFLLIRNPLQLWQSGFQLSALAVLAAAGFWPVMRSYIGTFAAGKKLYGKGESGSRRKGHAILSKIWVRQVKDRQVIDHQAAGRQVIDHQVEGRQVMGRPVIDHQVAGRQVMGRPVMGQQTAGHPVMGRLIRFFAWALKFLQSRRQSRQPFLSRLADGLGLTLSIQLITAPVIAAMNGSVPVYGLFVNLLSLPFAGVLLAASLLGAGLSGFLPEGFTRILYLPGDLILRYIRGLCQITADLAGSVLVTGKPGLLQSLAAAVLLGLLWLHAIRVRRRELGGRQKFRPGRLALLAAAGLCTGMILMPPPFRDIQITFLDVGQGDSVFIRTKSHAALIDGGSSSASHIGIYRILPFLGSQGVRHLDAIFLTHPDGDHMNGLKEVLDSSSVSVGTLYMTGAGALDSGTEELIDAAEKNHVPIRILKTGDHWSFDEADFSCIYPGEEEVKLWGKEDINNTSLTLRMEAGDFSALFTGDLGEEGERRLMAGEKTEKVTLLKAGHHGSKYSSSYEFLKSLSPKITVISCGQGNRYGHPHREMLERLNKTGSALARTDLNGAITIRLREGKMQVFGYRNPGGKVQPAG